MTNAGYRDSRIFSVAAFNHQENIILVGTGKQLEEIVGPHLQQPLLQHSLLGVLSTASPYRNQNYAALHFTDVSNDPDFDILPKVKLDLNIYHSY